MHGHSLTCRLAVALAMTLASVAAVRAYSPEAVTDAEEILKTTTTRFAAGEVIKSDVALASFNVLDMKLKAGQVSTSDFCRSAKPDLTAVAGSFEAPEAYAHDRQKWLDSIAAMDGDEAKCRDASAWTEKLLFRAEPAAVSATAVKDAMQLLAATIDRYSTGEVTSTDVASARYRLFEVKYGAKAVARETYCQAGVPLLWQFAEGVEQEERVGQRSLADGIAAKRRLHAAKAQCSDVLTGDPKEIAALAQSGASHRDKKEFDAAIADFTEVLRLAPQDTQALLSRAAAYEANVDTEHALADYDAALRLDPTDWGALHARAGFRYAAGDPDGAIADYTALLKLDPDDLTAHINRAAASFAKKDYANAVADYSFAVEHAPPADPIFRFSTLKDVLTYRAYAYGMQGDYDRAIADYTELLRIKPDDVRSLSARANAYYAKRDYDRAIEGLGAILQVEPRNTTAFLMRGAVNHAKGNYQSAIADYDEVIRLDPQNVSAFMQRGAAHEQVKDYERAIADYGEAIGLHPANAEAYNGRCWDRAISGHVQDALADCDESLRLRPDHVNTLDSRGFVHLALGQFDSAIADYDAALRSDSKLATALYGRGLARQKKGDAAGEADVTAATAIDPDLPKRFADYGVK